MTTIAQYLNNYKEEMPQWLKDYQPGQRVAFSDFINSRCLYYPGSGYDGQPVMTFNQSHCVHCYVYVDYGFEKCILNGQLNDRYHSFKGYHSIGRVEYSESDLMPKHFVPTLLPGYTPRRDPMTFVHGRPFCFLEIMERDEQYDDSHGAKRFAVLFLFADGIATYQAFFTPKGLGKTPYVLILQDHGFGGNYDLFGKGGLMERIAEDGSGHPEWALVADNTRVWEGYDEIADLEPVDLGGRTHVRKLFRKIK